MKVNTSQFGKAMSAALFFPLQNATGKKNAFLKAVKAGSFKQLFLFAVMLLAFATTTEASPMRTTFNDLHHVTTYSTSHLNWGWNEDGNGYYVHDTIRVNPIGEYDPESPGINERPYQIGVSADHNEGIAHGGGNFSGGDLCIVRAEPNMDHIFTYWTEDNVWVSSLAEYSFIVTCDRTLRANFRVKVPYTINATANPSVAGTVSGAGTILEGQTCILWATPATGYVFTSWTENGIVVSTDARYSFTVTEGRTLVANFSENIFIGSENSQLINNGPTIPYNYLPSYTRTKYSLSEQIYTAAELGDAGSITSIAFYNEGNTVTRWYDIYLKNTGKSSFSDTTDWVPVEITERVFSGDVTMQANDWTVINFEIPFGYDGHNVILVVNDRTEMGNSMSPMISCRVFNTDESQALFRYSNNPGIDPWYPNNNPNGSSHLVSMKNQLLVTKTATNDYLPSYTHSNYSLSEQIFTAEELGGAGYITSVAFYNDGTEKTRTYDIYLKSTLKDRFYSNSDWENVSASDLVFSGSVTMQASHWTYIAFDTPYLYNGNSNVVLVVDDNTGSYDSSPTMSCRVFNTGSTQAIYVNSNYTNYDPSSPAFTGTRLSKKNQLFVAKDPAPTFNVSVSAILTEGGTVTGAGTYIQGQSCTVTATANEGYEFVNWKKNGEVVSSNASYSFTVTGNSILVAQFVLDGIIVFADADVKELCVTNWDTNGDGELNYAEAAAVTSLENVFYGNSSITSFDELQYFIGLTSIGSLEFYDCHSLTSIEIPNSVTSIGEYAFYYCTGLTSMTVLADNPPVLGSNVFHGVNNSIPVYVPCGSLEAYQLAVGWNQFTNIQEVCTQPQTIELVAGWNWFSTNLEITLDELKEALIEVAPGTNILIKSKTQNTVYNPVTNQWRGTLNTLDLTQMYMISVCTNCEIILTGTPINPTEHPITIQNGFNWIEFPLSENMSISNAFEGIVVNGDVIKSKTNNASYINGQWRGNFNTLEPGKGYIYKSNSVETKTLVF